MTKEQALEKLIDQINNDMAIFVGILAIVLAAFLYFQWSLSEKKIKQLKSDIEQDLVEKYTVDRIKDLLDDTNKITKRLNTIDNKTKNNLKNHKELEKVVIKEETNRFFRLIERIDSQLNSLRTNKQNNTEFDYSEISNNIRLACENVLIDKGIKSIVIYQIYKKIKLFPQLPNSYKLRWESIISQEAKEELEVGKQFDEKLTDSFNRFNNSES
ncbi:hypothetical protein MM193_00520 [Limosilactobacillus reuteri]|uniref:hypothetical protein n=1 Tax=Limosilactobacillus reuteri TaxID=1598 RepID=UPI001F4DE610|nr:hypothetical protein [Limosilactobacillus reuteri]MCH9393182.1 hypothetical protein [Limosilactobacillus reuteri]